MFRSAESPIHEHVANAARNDLPREVLSYADGLVLQAKEIIDRHGVTLEDLKKPEVRERIAAEDIRRLLDLSAKNAAARRGEVGAAARREIADRLSARELAAWDLLEKALDRMPETTETSETICASFLRAGLPEEALHFLNRNRLGSVGLPLRLRLLIAAARDPAVALEEKKAYLNEARRRIEKITDPFECIQERLDWLDTELSLLDDVALPAFVARLMSRESNLSIPEVERVRAELVRRGVRFSENQIETTIAAAHDVLSDGSVSVQLRINTLLALAETRLRIGEDAREPVLRAIGVLQAELTFEGAFIPSNLIESCVRMAAKIHDDGQVERLQTTRWYFGAKAGSLSQRQYTREMVLGWLDSKDFDRAVEWVRDDVADIVSWDQSKFSMVPSVVESLIRAGEVDRAEELMEETHLGDAWLFFEIRLARIAKRASAGEDTLEDAANAAMIPEDLPVCLSTAAIATIGYVRAEKKRMDKYVPKR